MPGCDLAANLSSWPRAGSAPCALRSMSEFKFACPVCGQHITCDSRTSGSQMECPTCFRKLIVPQPSAAGSPNLVLTASEVTNRPSPTGAAGSLAVAFEKKFPFAAVALLLVRCPDDR